MRSHDLSNRVFAEYDEVFDETKASWLRLTPDRLKSLTACVRQRRPRRTGLGSTDIQAQRDCGDWRSMA